MALNILRPKTSRRGMQVKNGRCKADMEDISSFVEAIDAQSPRL
jgi:hypothetical protein